VNGLLRIPKGLEMDGLFGVLEVVELPALLGLCARGFAPMF